MKNRIATALLALFLGGIGIHRFYLNQPGKGILYLIFCWTFIPAIVALVDFIIFITMDDETFNEKYNDEEPLTIRNKGNVTEEIEKLYVLKEKNIITETEFNERKSKLLK